MKIQLKKRYFKDVKIGIIYGFIGLFGVCLSLFVPNLLNYIPPCLFQQWTGLPCPSCGASRTGILSSHLHIWEAFTTNPLFFLIYVLLLLWVLNSAAGWWFNKNIQILLSDRDRKMIFKAGLFSIPLNWLYLILRHTIH